MVADLQVFLVFQLALLPLQALLFIGTYRNWHRVQTLYNKSLIRLVHATRGR